MRITREDYQIYLKYLHKYNIVEGIIAIFIDKHKEDVEKAFKGTNIRAIEL